MSNRAFSKIWIIVIIFIVLAGGILAWQYLGIPRKETTEAPGQKTSVVDWTGIYEYSEFAPPNQTWVYKLEIYKEESQLKARLDIDGFQTLTRIQAIAKENNGNLDVIFDGYRPENIYTPYGKGDLLFSLQEISNQSYKIIWHELKSNLLGPLTAEFKKLEAPTIPRFEDFPVPEKFEGTPAQVDFSTNPDMLRFVTRITEGAQKGPNFAGHYTVISWGCGTECQSGVIIDAKTGTIFSSFVTELDSEFRIDSNLFIVNPPKTIEEVYGGWEIPEWVYTAYYKWENNQFVKIFDTKTSE